MLAHEIAARCSENEGKKVGRRQRLRSSRARPDSAVREVGETHLRTRASDVRPAIAMPTWSSIRNIFCWYEASSPLERWRSRGEVAVAETRELIVVKHLESEENGMRFRAQTDRR